MKTVINLDNGKYTVTHDNGADFKALRYGKEWRDLCGDGLVLAMAQEIERFRETLDKYKEYSEQAVSYYSEDSSVMGVDSRCTADWFVGLAYLTTKEGEE